MKPCLNPISNLHSNVNRFSITSKRERNFRITFKQPLAHNKSCFDMKVKNKKKLTNC